MGLMNTSTAPNSSYGNCTFPRCDRVIGPAGAKGFCPKHYQRLTKAAEGLTEPVKELPLALRFAAKVLPSGACLCGCSCERWAAGISPRTGYAVFWTNGKQQLAHRVAWSLYRGGTPVPEGFYVDHVKDRGCVHRDCVKYEHLEAVTPAVNAQRARRNLEAASRGGSKGGVNKGRHLTLAERFAELAPDVRCLCGCSCRRWKGTVNNKTGYGNISVNGTTELAHRVAWSLANYEPVPGGLHVDHVKDQGCVHRDCVKSEHLEAVTRKVNAQRGAMGTRRAGNAAAEQGERILALLADRPGGLSVARIRKELGTSTTMTYAYIKALVQTGKLKKQGTVYAITL